MGLTPRGVDLSGLLAFDTWDDVGQAALRLRRIRSSKG